MLVNKAPSKPRTSDNAVSPFVEQSTLVDGVEFDAPALVPLKTVSPARVAPRTSKEKGASGAKLKIATGDSAKPKAAVTASADEPSCAATPAASPNTPADSLPSPGSSSTSGRGAISAATPVSAAATPEIGAGGWADVVRKGKKTTSMDGAVGTTSSPSTPVLGSSKTGAVDDHEGGHNVKAGLGSVASPKPRATQSERIAAFQSLVRRKEQQDQLTNGW